jgi:hypothetical protein
MAKGARSKRMKMLRTQRRDRVAAWQEAAEQKRYASLAALAAAPRPPPPPGAMAIEVAADAEAAEASRGRTGRAAGRRDAMAVDRPSAKEPKAASAAGGVASGGVSKKKKKAAAGRRPKQHSILMEALGGWKVKKGAKRKGNQAPPTAH